MKLRWPIPLLMLIICNFLIELLSAHGLEEQTLIKTPHDFKTIETISKRVSKNKKIISYSEKKQSNITTNVKKSGRSDTNCHVRIILYNTTPAQPDEILCTPAQEFYVPATNSWVPAYNLRVGDKLKSNLHGTATIAQHDFIQKPLSIYMLEVEKYHNFFVSKQEILTHNTALPWEVAIWICIPFGETAVGAQAGSFFGPIGIMGGAVIGAVVGYGLQCVNNYDKVHLYNSFFNVDSIQALMKESLNLSESATNPRPSASIPSPDGSNTPEDPDKDPKKDIPNQERITIFENNAKHIFRKDRGHFKYDTPQNRKILEELVNDEKNYLGPKSPGIKCYGRIRDDGKQIWAEVKDNQIRNGGINDIPRHYNSTSGMAQQFKPLQTPKP